MQFLPYYIALTDLDGTLAHACDPSSFEDACDAFAEKMDEGFETWVFRVEPPKNGEAGICVDVTADAVQRVSDRLSQRGYDFPEWLMEAA